MDIATKTGVILTAEDLKTYECIRLSSSNGWMVTRIVLREERRRQQDLFSIRMNKLISLNLVKVDYDYAIGYSATKVKLSDVADMETNPDEYRYR